MKKEPVMAGLVVVDFTQFFAGPIVTQSLAELGAEVIKVEFAPTGDPGRYLPLVKNQRSGYFIQQNTGKKSLCVDLKTTEGKRLVLDLIKKADVLVENYAPGAIARLGFGWDAVRALNPRLIMCSVSAFGQSGPLSNMPGFDFTGQAYSGVASMVGDSDGAPALIGLALGDCGTGMSALAAVNAALYRREKTGEGAYVESTLIEQQTNFIGRQGFWRDQLVNTQVGKSDLVCVFDELSIRNTRNSAFCSQLLCKNTDRNVRGLTGGNPNHQFGIGDICILKYRNRGCISFDHPNIQMRICIQQTGTVSIDQSNVLRFKGKQFG